MYVMRTLEAGMASLRHEESWDVRRGSYASKVLVVQVHDVSHGLLCGRDIAILGYFDGR
jgi:hypothetical protein